jgi:hypothetical protein
MPVHEFGERRLRFFVGVAAEERGVIFHDRSLS